MTDVDVVVVGAGPAGACAALVAALVLVDHVQRESFAGFFQNGICPSLVEAQ